MNSIVVLGGCFNPITLAHIDILQRAITFANADSGIILPTGNSYKKSEIIPFASRLDMINLAIEPISNISVSTYENECESQPKTLQSLNHLSNIYPDSIIYFLIGTDNLEHFHEWYQPAELLNKHRLIVISRDTHNSAFSILNQPFFQDYLDSISILNASAISLESSSSKARLLSKSNKHGELELLLNSEVTNYIILNNLYSQQTNNKQ